MLHAIRAGLPGVLGDRPAILARQISQQPEHEPRDPSPWLDPRKPAGHPTEQLLQHPRPWLHRYAAAHGHRLIL
jgi:hypothetical protein